MKKVTVYVCLLCRLSVLLCACGGIRDGSAAPEVDLPAFMEELLSRYELGAVEAAGEELTAAFYPGLSNLDPVQQVVYMPLITGVVSEYVFLQCADKETAARAAEILQARVDAQADGGAWYPESVENWAKAKVLVKGKYVAMIAAGEDTDSIAADFEKLF